MTQTPRERILDRMSQVIGPLATHADELPLDVQTVEETSAPGVVRRKITFLAEPGERIPAYLLLPERPRASGLAMVCPHQTTAVGKAEPAGLAGRPTLHYALELAQRGVVTLAPDLPTFGELADREPCPDGYVSGTMKAIQIHRRAVTLLQGLDSVDPMRIGAIGHSLGGHNSLFLAAFDPRVRLVVTSCGFDTFATYAVRHGDLRAWASRRYMPRVAEAYGSDPLRMPFDFTDVLAAIAPRPVFVNAPLHDDNFDPEGVRTCLAHAAPIYEQAGAGDRLVARFPDAEHDFPDAQREAAYQFTLDMLAAE